LQSQNIIKNNGYMIYYYHTRLNINNWYFK